MKHIAILARAQTPCPFGFFFCLFFFLRLCSFTEFSLAFYCCCCHFQDENQPMNIIMHSDVISCSWLLNDVGSKWWRNRIKVECLFFVSCHLIEKKTTFSRSNFHFSFHFHRMRMKRKKSALFLRLRKKMAILCVNSERVNQINALKKSVSFRN